jgi:CelD/BcsL family acetyltransferase involved in cellulose biosynthesis
MADIAITLELPRPAATTSIVLEIADADGLRQLDRTDWRRLAASALVENPFFGPSQVLAGLETVDADLDIRALVMRGADGTMVGFFPYNRRSRTRYPLPVAFGACNEFQYAGTPLVDRTCAPAVIDAFLDHVSRPLTRHPWALRQAELQSDFANLLLRRAAERGITVAAVNVYDRAFLTHIQGGFDAHVSQVLSKNRLKDLRRTSRRLEEMGTLTLERTSSVAETEARLADFLALEHSGWKREQGTSILSNSVHAEYARRAYVGEGVTYDTLLLDGRPIAMKLTIRDGRTAFTPKIAYDETLRKLGPGMVLEYKLLEAFYSQSEVDGIDAAATAQDHSALNFFNTTKRVGTMILGRSRFQVRLLAETYEFREKFMPRPPRPSEP